MDQSHMRSAEARQPQGSHGLPHMQDHSGKRHHRSVDDDVFDVAFLTVEGPLFRKAGEEDISVAEVFRVDSTRAEDGRHDGRFDELKSHCGVLPARLVVLAACARAKEPVCTEISKYAIGQLSRLQLFVEGKQRKVIEISGNMVSNSLLRSLTAADAPGAMFLPASGAQLSVTP